MVSRRDETMIGALEGCFTHLTLQRSAFTFVLHVSDLTCPMSAFTSSFPTSSLPNPTPVHISAAAYRNSSRVSPWTLPPSCCLPATSCLWINLSLSCLLATYKFAQRPTATSSTPAGYAPSSFPPVSSTVVSLAATQSTKIASTNSLSPPQTKTRLPFSANANTSFAVP